MTLDFIQKRLQEQFDYIDELSKRPESPRRREVLDSARERLAYLLDQRDKITKLNGKS